MPIDYSQFSTEDLQAMKAGNIKGISNEGLQTYKSMLEGSYAPAPVEAEQEAAPPVQQEPEETLFPEAAAAGAEAQLMQDLISLGMANSEDLIGQALDPEGYLERLRRTAGTLEFSAAGAMAGAEAGVMASPPDPRMKFAAAVLGGAAGAFGGEFIEGTIRGTHYTNNFLNSWEAGKEDAVFSLGGMAAIQTLGYLGKGTAKVLGVDFDKAYSLLESSGKYGGHIGVLDVTKFAPVKGVKPILGLFPWVGTPIRTGAKITQDAVVRGIDSRLNLLAPNASLANLGLDMVEAAGKAYDEFKGVAKIMYDKAEDYATKRGVTVPTADLRDVAKAVLPRRNFPEVTKGQFPQGEPSELEEFFIAVSSIKEDQIPVSELRSLQTRLNEIWDAGRRGTELPNLDKARIAKFRAATEAAIANITHANPKVAEEVRKYYEEANEFYATGMKRFDTTTGVALARADKNLFRGGAEVHGNLTADRVAEAALDLKSPQSIRQLQAIVGDDLVAAAVREHLDRSLHSSMKIDGEVTTFNFHNMFNALGEGQSRNVSKAALAEAMAPKGVEINDFIELLHMAEAKGQIPLANKFIARRAVLGGSGSALRGMLGLGLAGGTAGLGAVPSVTAFAVMRGGVQILQSEKFLKALVRAKDTDISSSQRYIHLVRAMDAVFQEVPLTQEEKKEAILWKARNSGTE